MAIGMTYDEYWYGDPLLVRAFYKADQLRRKRADENAWLTGLYVMNALNATVGNMFRKSGQAPVEYPKEPFSMQDKPKDTEEMTEEEKERDATWALAWMTSFVEAGKNYGKNKERLG